MTDGRMDRRISHTRRLLREALWALILERGYDTLTVEDITNRADLGRTTFYLHYRDKEELLLESLEAIADELITQVTRSGAHANELPHDPHRIAIAFQHAAEHRDLYRIILKGEGGSRAFSKVRDIITDEAVEYFQRNLGSLVQPTSEIPVEAVAGYFASALLGFLTWWLEKELPYSGAQAAEIFTRLFFEGARTVLHAGAWPPPHSAAGA